MRIKLTKPDDKRLAWIDRLEERSNSSLSLLMKIDGKVVAVRLMRPLESDAVAHDDVLDKAAASLMFAVSELST